jgi:hypothetical protein
MYAANHADDMSRLPTMLSPPACSGTQCNLPDPNSRQRLAVDGSIHSRDFSIQLDTTPLPKYFKLTKREMEILHTVRFSVGVSAPQSYLSLRICRPELFK